MPAFRSDPRCSVVALAASELSRAARVAERLGVPSAYGDWRELIASADVDIVSIAVPPALQPEVVTAAAEARKAVFCEKPPAVDAAAAERMLAAVRASGVVHAVDLEFAELPAWLAARRLLQDGAVGRPTSLSISWRVRTSARSADSWKERADAGGGAIGGFASHALYLIEWSVAPIRALAAWLGAERGRTRVEAWLHLANGCRATLSVATDATRPSGSRFEVEGNAGTLVVENPGPDHVRGHRLSLARAGGSLESVPCADLPDTTEDGRVAATTLLVARFVDAVRGGPPMRPDLADGLRVQRLLDALVSADSIRGWITV